MFKAETLITAGNQHNSVTQTEHFILASHHLVTFSSLFFFFLFSTTKFSKSVFTNWLFKCIRLALYSAEVVQWSPLVCGASSDSWTAKFI